MSSLNDPRDHILPLSFGKRQFSLDHPYPAETWVANPEEFRRVLLGWSVKFLRDHVDQYLVAMDEAKARRDRYALERSSAQWNAVWDEIELRDALAAEAAS